MAFMNRNVIIMCYLQISRVLQKYEVGELVNNEHPVFPEPGYVWYHGDLNIILILLYADHSSVQ